MCKSDDGIWRSDEEAKMPVVFTTKEKKKKFEVAGCVEHPDGSVMPVVF